MEQPDTARLVQEISTDPTLSAQVLRLANSPLFGLVQQVRSVQRAIVLLGLVREQSLIMSGRDYQLHAGSAADGGAR
jgi:HD-like signal output (HDOD) protein